jgi:hypothetical protein
LIKSGPERFDFAPLEQIRDNVETKCLNVLSKHGVRAQRLLAHQLFHFSFADHSDA